MKQTVLAGAVALLGAWACSACRPKEPAPEHRFESLEIERTEKLTDEEGAPAGQIRIQMDYLADKNAVSLQTNRTVMERMYGGPHTVPQAAADSFAQQYLQRYREELEPLYRQEAKSQVIRTWYAYDRQITARNITEGEELIQYRITQRYHEGGTAPYEETVYLNFDARSGALLTGDSLFRKGSRIELEALLLQELEKEQDAVSLDELRKKGFLRLTPMYVTENFLLEEEGIRFHYQPAELASYEKGAVEIHLTYKKLKHILTEKTKDIWSRF